MNKVLDGMNLIAKYEPDANTAADHDIIYFGGFNPEQMTGEDVSTLVKLGWSYHREYQSWTHFV